MYSESWPRAKSQVKARSSGSGQHGLGERGVHQEPEHLAHDDRVRRGGFVGRAAELVKLRGPVVGARVPEDLLGLTA